MVLKTLNARQRKPVTPESQETNEVSPTLLPEEFPDQSRARGRQVESSGLLQQEVKPGAWGQGTEPKWPELHRTLEL